MPSEKNHIAIANANQDALGCLLSSSSKHPRWLAAVAFYKALHIIEAVFAVAGEHFNGHSKREEYLGSHHSYRHIAKHYFPLSRAAHSARYSVHFGRKYKIDVVIGELLRHRLLQIEASAKKFLNEPGELREVKELFS